MSLQYFKRTQVTHDLGLSSNAQTILEYLLFCSQREGYAWPSISDIAEKAGCSTRTVQTIIRDLDSKGFITIKERTARNGKPMSHRYTPATELLSKYSRAVHIEKKKKTKSLKEQLNAVDAESGRVRAVVISARVLAMAGLLPKNTAYQHLQNLLEIFATNQEAVNRSIEMCKSEIEMNDLNDIGEILQDIPEIFQDE